MYDRKDQKFLINAIKAREGVKEFQHFPFSTIATDPLYVHSLSVGERELFLFLSCRAWQKKSLILRTSFSYLADGIGMGSRTIQRHLKGLISMRLLTLLRADHKNGNEYLVEPLLLPEYCWKARPLRFLEQTRLFELSQNGLTAWREIQANFERLGQNGLTHRSKWPISSHLARTQLGQNGQQMYLLYSLLLRDDAERHTTNPISGGVENQPSKEEKEARSPNGQIRKTRKEGIGLSPNDFEKKRTELIAYLRNEESLKTVSNEGEQSEFHAIGGENEAIATNILEQSVPN